MAVYQVSSQVLVIQLCLTLCNPTDFSQPGSSVHGILQARVPEWVAIPFSRGSFQPRDWTWVPCIAGGFLNVWTTRETHGCLCVLSHTHRHTATQFCHGSVSSHTQHTNEQMWMCRVEIYLQKQAAGWIWPITLVYQPLPYIMEKAMAPHSSILA